VRNTVKTKKYLLEIKVHEEKKERKEMIFVFRE
jgi:hypothetical protein